MNLQDTVAEMTGKPVTVEEAKTFANDQFGALTAYVKQKSPKTFFPPMSETRKALLELWNKLDKSTRPTWDDYRLDAEAAAYREFIKDI